ncbi:hypothetical protein M15_09960 [Atrimonas thermophila]
MQTFRLKKFTTIAFFVGLFMLALSASSWAKILSPEEAKLFLEEIHHKQHMRSFWSFWKVENLVTKETFFYEVAFIKEKGILWRNLGEENLLFIDSEGWRHVINLKENREIAMYPAVCPFEFLDLNNLDALLDNYLVEMQSGSIAFVSRETQKVQKVLLLDKEHNVKGVFNFSPQGEALSIARLVYIDFSPDTNQLAQLNTWSVKNPYPEEPGEKDRKEKYPLFFPPGFKLKKVYKIVENGRIWHYLVYTDGLYFVSVFYNPFPFLVEKRLFFLNSVSRYLKKGTTTLVKEEKGHYFLISGPFQEEFLKNVLQLFSSLKSQ